MAYGYLPSRRAFRLTGTSLYCLVTEAHKCHQLVKVTGRGTVYIRTRDHTRCNHYTTTPHCRPMVLLLSIFPFYPHSFPSHSLPVPETVWNLLKQETVSGSGISWAICKSASCCRQITTSMTRAPTTQFLQARSSPLKSS